jgi:alpha-L-fucosidase
MQDTVAAIPTREQVEWSTCELGALIHYDIGVFEPEYSFRNQWGYVPDPSIFNPQKLDTDQWVKSAVEAGIKYIVLVAKHCSGFCLWPTKEYEYSVKNTPYKNGQGDIVGEFIASCRKYGIKPGLYYSASCNAYLNVDNPGTVRTGNIEDQKRYNKIVENQLTELWTNYGDLFEIWFDGGCLPVDKGGPNIPSLLKKYQPNAVVFQGPQGTKSLIRWVGNENGVAPLNCWSTSLTSGDSYTGVFEVDNLSGSPFGSIWSPGECDVPLRRHEAFGGGWFWKKDEEKYVHTAEHFLELYYESVGRNTNLLIGLVIDDRGLVPDLDTIVLKEFGEKVKALYYRKIDEVSGRDTEYLLDTNGASVGTIVIMEDITKGHQILNFTLYGTINDNNEVIFKGETVGYKRLVNAEGKVFDKIKLVIENYRELPFVKSFAAYKFK